MTQEPIIKTARLSADGIYRYRLTRSWGPGAFLPFVMLNPSVADADVDDPTIRRCMGFARREGAGGIIVVNLFALRATEPERLKEVNDPFGPGNHDALYEAAIDAVTMDMPVVCAWGAGGVVHGGYRSCIDQFQRAGARLVCLGKTKDGHPRHPLYVRRDQPLIPLLTTDETVLRAVA